MPPPKKQPKDYEEAQDRRTSGALQRILETLFVSATIGAFTVGVSTWDRSGDNADALVRVADEIVQLKEYILKLEDYTDKVKERVHQLEIKVETNIIEDRSAHQRINP